MNYEKFGLKENPFRLTPPLNPNEIKWAGMKAIKKQIEKRIELAILTNPSKIVINWGTYGSGKTHSAIYFSKTNRIKELADKLKKSSPKSIKITLPRVSNNIVQEFLRSFLGQYPLDEIKKDLLKIKEENTDEFNKLVDLFSNDNLIKIIVNKIINSDSEEYEILKNYIYGDSTKTTLNSLELPYGLNNDEQIANLLSCIINLITFEKKYFSAFILWIDEFEDIDMLKKSLADRFTTFLRQFIDKTPNNLLIFINFTQKTFMNLEDLSLYLGEALTSRIKIKIEFKSPTIEEAKEYVKELCSFYEIKDTQCVFSDEIIEYILQHIEEPLTARKINEVFSIILEMTLLENKHNIDKEFIESIKEEIISWKES